MSWVYSYSRLGLIMLGRLVKMPGPMPTCKRACSTWGVASQADSVAQNIWRLESTHVWNGNIRRKKNTATKCEEIGPSMSEPRFIAWLSDHLRNCKPGRSEDSSTLLPSTVKFMKTSLESQVDCAHQGPRSPMVWVSMLASPESRNICKKPGMETWQWLTSTCLSRSSNFHYDCFVRVFLLLHLFIKKLLLLFLR